MPIRNLSRLLIIQSSTWENIVIFWKLRRRKERRRKKLTKRTRRRTRRKKLNKMKLRSCHLLKPWGRRLITTAKSLRKLLALIPWKRHWDGRRMSPVLSSITKRTWRRTSFTHRQIHRLFRFSFISISPCWCSRVSREFWMPVLTILTLSSWLWES